MCPERRSWSGWMVSVTVAVWPRRLLSISCASFVLNCKVRIMMYDLPQRIFIRIKWVSTWQAFEQCHVCSQHSTDAGYCPPHHLCHHEFHHYHDYLKTKWLGFKFVSLTKIQREFFPSLLDCYSLEHLYNMIQFSAFLLKFKYCLLKMHKWGNLVTIIQKQLLGLMEGHGSLIWFWE